jgi:outer membrane protein TolC
MWLAVAAAITAAATIIVQLRVRKENKVDHATVYETLSELVLEQRETRLDVSEVKADVRDVKADVRDLGGRVDSLEHKTVIEVNPIQREAG